MGYTHYYYTKSEYNFERFGNVLNDFKKLIPIIEGKTKEFQVVKKIKGELGIFNQVASIKLCGGMGDGLPELTNEIICFNGSNIGDLGHETFLLEQKREPNSFEQYDKLNKLFFNFTKTARKPYDLAVCVCLIIAKEYFRDEIIIKSDGTLDEWQPAIDLVNDYLGYGKNFQLNEEYEANFEVIDK